jgi:proteasome lid subunit RPN8/RPN11
MIAALVLPPALRAHIEDAARTAFPRECCGLMEGLCSGDAVRAIALHPARNLSADAERFEIDPTDHFAALHASRANGHEIVGCYHSHPNGVAQISARDREGAMDDGFIWLVCAVTPEQTRTVAFIHENGQFRALKLLDIAAA